MSDKIAIKTNSYTGYSTNVNFIKFLAAIMVILSHAFPLSTGASQNEWFHILTNGQYTMGGVAVCIFFFYSGLLIAKSLVKKPTAKHYFMNRILRIIPPLMVVAVVSAIIMGPLVTTLPLSKYFISSGTWFYLLNGILVLVHNLPGVFEQNIYLSTVNGSLWTLPVEAFCYVACFVFFKLKLNTRYHGLIMKMCMFLSIPFIFFLLLFSGYAGLGMICPVIFPVFIFFSGMFYYVFRDVIKMDLRYLGLAILVIIISNFSGYLLLGLFLGFPYILAYIGFACKKLPERLGNLGKLSYGIYLCAFPIQQCLVWGFGGSMNIYLNMLLAIPLSILGGWALYEFVEKRIHNN